MVRVYALYRVSTVGQVDHDDIPMQRLACQDFVKRQEDWQIVREFYEKGVSGYKIKADKRDAIAEGKDHSIMRLQHCRPSGRRFFYALHSESTISISS